MGMFFISLLCLPGHATIETQCLLDPVFEAGYLYLPTMNQYIRVWQGLPKGPRRISLILQRSAVRV